MISRAFVKDADYLEELPERPVSEHPNDVTEAGLAQVEHALAAAGEAYAAAQASPSQSLSPMITEGRGRRRGPSALMATNF